MTSSGWLLVALGGAAGAVLRYLAGHLGDAPRQVPWGTVAVNLVGSFVLGVVVGLGTDGLGYDLAGLGFCGALTTYSSFAVQVHERGARLGAVTMLVTAPPALLLYAAGHWFGTIGG